jgi:shikimate dehydrogenase
MNKLKTLISNKDLIIKTKKYTSIIGLSPSKGARSPKLWNRAYKKYGIKNEMVPFDVTSKNLSKLVKFLNKDSNFIGGCITVPYKEKIFKLLKNNITKASKKIGAVNCLFRDKKGRLVGTNTDGEAAIASFKKKFGNVKNEKILLMGVGGAGKAVASYFSSEIGKKNNLTILGRSKNSKAFSQKIKANWSNFRELKKLNLEKFEIIINCTSLGFGKKKNNSPIENKKFKLFSRKAKIFDIIYDPKKTKFLKIAEKCKLKSLNGLDMNLRQAVLAFGYVNNKLKTNSKTLKFMRTA